MSEPFATLPKNSRERIQVDFRAYEGHDFLDLRVHYLKADGESYSPTPKGVTVKPAQIGELIEVLQRAQVEARARGLIGGDA